MQKNCLSKKVILISREESNIDRGRIESTVQKKKSAKKDSAKHHSNY